MRYALYVGTKSSSRSSFRFEVIEFHHLLARLMSLLFCCALQQVSPMKDRPFEILDTQGIELESLLSGPRLAR